MTLQFPNNPSNGQQFTASNGLIYRWDGEKWITLGSAQSTGDIYVQKIGDTMTGQLVLPGGGTGKQAATVDQVDAAQAAATGVANAAQTTANAAVVRTGDTMTGNLTVPSLNGAALAGFRNQIINGDFRIWQRGNSFNFSSTAYTADRWKQSLYSGSAQGSISNLTKPSFATTAYYLTSGGGVQQGVELPLNGSGNGRCGPFAIGTVWTLSVWSDKDLTGSSSMFRFRDEVSVANANDVDAASSIPNWSQISTVADNGFHQYAITVTIDASPNDSNRSFCINLPGTAATGENTAYANCQLEPGPVATPFEHRPIGTEFALCERYYHKARIGGKWGAPIARAASDKILYVNYMPPVALRVTGTVTLSSPAAFSSAVADNSTASGLSVYSNGLSLGLAYKLGILYGASSTAATIYGWQFSAVFDAEL